MHTASVSLHEVTLVEATIDGLYGNPKYIVWSIHTYLSPGMPNNNYLDEVFGDISDAGGTRLGYIYFKRDQWACSYGMKLVNASGELAFLLEFESKYGITFWITDYQIVAFDDLYSANAYINSREFAKFSGDK